MAQRAADYGSSFDASERFYRGWLGDLTDAVDDVLVDARARFVALAPTLVYRDEPDHPMANSLETCAKLLSLYLPLRERGVDVHRFGARMLEGLAAAASEARARREAKGQTRDAAEVAKNLLKLEAAGTAARSAQRPGEFQFDVQLVDEDTGEWTMAMTSCGICHLFGAHDAMDLVPYMCATDDVMSDMVDDGLTRTGTIALGAHQCDFHYRPGQPTDPLVDHYPDRIRISALD